MNIENKIFTWKNLTSDITEQWIKEYFDWDDDEEVHFDWVSDEPGGVFNFSDYWFSFDTVLKCYELNISKERLMSWYYWCLDNQSVNISLAKYILSPQERREAEEKHLQELKERVELAEKEFQKAIDEYTSKNNI